MFVRPALALVLSLALTSAAYSQELIRNDAANADPKPAAAPASDATTDAVHADAEANGAWARAVMDKAADGKTASAGKRACMRDPDRAAHGEVWAGAGSNGYREVGGVATQAIGNCSSLTLGYEQGQIDGGNGRGRRGR